MVLESGAASSSSKSSLGAAASGSGSQRRVATASGGMWTGDDYVAEDGEDEDAAAWLGVGSNISRGLKAGGAAPKSGAKRKKNVEIYEEDQEEEDEEEEEEEDDFAAGAAKSKGKGSMGKGAKGKTKKNQAGYSATSPFAQPVAASRSSPPQQQQQQPQKKQQQQQQRTSNSKGPGDNKTMKQEIVILSKSSREQEACTTTVVLVPASDATLAIPLEHQADAWRWAVKLGNQNELGTPAQLIGAKVLGILIKEIKRRKGDFTDLETYQHLIKADELEEFVEWHQAAKAALGMSRALDESLSEVIVRRKPPRIYRGNYVEGEEERIMIKVRPKMEVASMWRSALYLLKGLAEASGGYVSYKQPTPPGIRKLQGKKQQQQDQDWV